MLSEKMLDALNEQVKHELDSAYIYLSMSAYCEAQNLPGFAHWMLLQAQEEQEHAMRFFRFINERGGRVILQALEQPPSEFESPTDVFAKTLEHEQFITGRINHLYALALEEQDFASQTFLHWFIDEQVEEEATAAEILDTLKMVGGHPHSVLMLDRQLAQRSEE
ncbi:MAG: ferritin [Anaerolineae bacterium]|nr:ferritin [Anaerolineae bacterium]